MRLLRPDRLHVVDGQLWVLDGTQPVALVLGDESPKIVAWTHLPQAPVCEYIGWRFSTALSWGDTLWVQERIGEPVGRVTSDGLVEVAWSGGKRLLAAGPGCAWLAPEPSDQNIMTIEELRQRGATDEHLSGTAALRIMEHGGGSLVRLRPGAQAESFDIDGAVRWARSGPDALYLEVETAFVMLRELGPGDFDAEPVTRWLRLPWDARLPDVITVDDFGVEDDDVPSEVPPGGAREGMSVSVDDEGNEPLLHRGLQWRTGRDAADEPTEPDGGWSFGWFAYAPLPDRMFFPESEAVDPESGEETPVGRIFDIDTHGAERPWVVEARDAGGHLVAREEFAQGDVVAMIPWGAGVAVIHRTDDASTDVLVLAPNEEPAVLTSADVDITAWCRPLVTRPAETDSYLAQILATHGAPEYAGADDLATRLVGEWPDTRLEWSFTLPTHPGVRLRRHLPLFDETGRIDDTALEYADIHLMEDIATGTIPPVEQAVDGVLDV